MPVTCPYPEPALSSPYPRIPLPEDPSYCYLPIYAWVSQVVSSLRFSHQNPIYTSPPYVLHARPSYSFRFCHPKNIGWGVQILSSSLCSFLEHFEPNKTVVEGGIKRSARSKVSRFTWSVNKVKRLIQYNSVFIFKLQMELVSLKIVPFGGYPS